MNDFDVKFIVVKVVMYEQIHSTFPSLFSSNPVPTVIPPTLQLLKAIDMKDILKEKEKELQKEFIEEGPPNQADLASHTV